MAYLEIKHALLPAANSVPQEFIWITFDADPNVEDAALEWNTDKGFCFRLRADIAHQLLAKLSRALSDTRNQFSSLCRSLSAVAYASEVQFSFPRIHRQRRATAANNPHSLPSFDPLFRRFLIF